MAINYVVGDTVVSEDEYIDKLDSGAFADFQNKLQANPENATLELNAGALEGLESLELPGLVRESAGSNTPKFKPIGIGSPLSIEILTIYTGDAPRRWFGQHSDLLVASAVKSVETHDRAIRMINQVIPKLKAHQHYEPGALNDGSPIIYYTPAVVNSTLLFSFEMIATTFDDTLLQHLSTLLGASAAVPLFAPAAGYLLGGSLLTKITAQLGKALTSREPFLKHTLPLRFDTPLVPIGPARQAIIFDEPDGPELKAYKPWLVEYGPGRKRTMLVNKDSGDVYDGDAPYLIVSIDGRDRNHELEAFTPTLITASLLERFYGTNAGKDVVEAIRSGMMLLNDLEYHEQAKEAAGHLAKLKAQGQEDSEEYTSQEILLKAYKDNIHNEQFKNLLESAL